MTKLISLLSITLISLFLLNLAPKAKVMEEICDNGIDDNDDGIIDLNDPECICELIEPISLIPNHSFEERDCCPWQQSLLDECATDWVQASGATTDYIHTCDWLGWDRNVGFEHFPPPMPFPDGEGIVGFRNGYHPQDTLLPEWKEYAGTCLLSPLKADTTYRMQFDLGFIDKEKSPPINITIFGTPDCDYLPFGDGTALFGCPNFDPNWQELGSVYVSGGDGNVWVKSHIDISPDEDFAAIAIGPSCELIESDVSIYYYFDNLLLSDFESFALQISANSHPCKDDFTLEVPYDSDLEYQWYKNGITLLGETSPQISQMYGEGEYKVRGIKNGFCNISASYEFIIPSIIQSDTSFISICKNETYYFGNQELKESGIYVNTFKTIENCDSLVTVSLKVLGEFPDTITANIFAGQSYEIDDYGFRTEGEHLINFQSIQGCDSLILLQLEFYDIYIPNAFTPNEDGINDVFSMVAGNGLIEKVELTIFNRWGNKIYQGTDWNGWGKGKPAPEGVYVYLANIKMEDGLEEVFSGSITLLR